jgi:hypothetical protein
MRELLRSGLERSFWSEGAHPDLVDGSAFQVGPAAGLPRREGQSLPVQRCDWESKDNGADESPSADGHGRPQNRIFNPACIARGLLAPVITPKVALFDMFAPGALNQG